MKMRCQDSKTLAVLSLCYSVNLLSMCRVAKFDPVNSICQDFFARSYRPLHV